jgi:hypothetical protein
VGAVAVAVVAVGLAEAAVGLAEAAVCVVVVEVGGRRRGGVTGGVLELVLLLTALL